MLETFETERLILRKFTLEDAQASFEMNNDPEVVKYVPKQAFGTIEEVRELIKKSTLADYQKHGFGRMAVILKETGEFMGFSGLKDEPDLGGVDLGFRFKKKFWGKGYGTESAKPFIDIAFQKMKLKKLYAGAMKENKGSVNILKKLEFKYIHTTDFMGDAFDIYELNNPLYT